MARLPKGKAVLPLPPFKAWLASNIPAVYDNTMTYYEELCALIKYLQSVVLPALNENAAAVTVISNAVEQLQKYVEDYFKNLDVQEEINNKLDEMAEDGTLQEIISSYIQANVAWTFDTVADMQASTNLIEGSYARTIGYYSANDGGGALYKIKSSTGVTADEAFIVTVNDELVAEMVIENDTVNFRQLGAKSEEDTGYAHTDCKAYLDKYMNKLDNIGNNTISLFIPAGIWCFSETLLNRDHGFNIYGEKSFAITTEHTDNSTIIAPVATNQKHIWKIGGTSDYSEAECPMVYNWNINNLIFSTAEYTTNRAIVTLLHVTKAALYLDAVTAGRSEFLQFNQVDGTALAITSSWENYFGILNFRRIYDFNTPAIHFVRSHPVAGAPSPDISSTDIQEIMMEGINGDYIYSDADSNLAELQIGNMNIESRLVQANGTEQGTIITNNNSKTADVHCSLFNLGQFMGVMIDQIKLSNFVNYKFTSSDDGTIYINDRIFTFRASSMFQIVVNKIISNYNRGLVTLAYKPADYMVNNRSRLIVDNFATYGELLTDNYPLVDTQFFPYIEVKNVTNSMGVVMEEYGTIPLYKHAMCSGNNQYVCYDSGATNPLHLAVRRKTTMNQTIATFTANPNLDMIVRIKAKNGLTGRIGYRATEPGGSETYYNGPSYTGTGDWQYVQMNLPALKSGTRIVLADGYGGYESDDDETIFDNITLIPRS